jgi:hypothetical protein
MQYKKFHILSVKPLYIKHSIHFNVEDGISHPSAGVLVLVKKPEKGVHHLLEGGHQFQYSFQC